jgi:hypothetical protein
VNCQLSVSITTKVVARITTLETMVTKVPEITLSTPEMSLVRRDMSSPVWCSVKNFIDRDCSRRYMRTFRSYMMRWLTSVFR